ncbi:MAG: SRPBCC family protein [Cyanobacteria bacterium P01_C01_bin.38]
MINQQDVPQEDLNSTGNSNPNLQAVTVEVEKITQRQRQITATIQIPHPVEKVWQVLTDYQALSDFVPSLASSKKLEHPTGGIRLEQIGSQRLLKLNFSARVVLDLEESFPDLISFQMVEGDFKDFSGSWRLNNCVLDDKTSTSLCYTVKVWPKLTMPIRIIEPRLSQDMQSNLLAIRERVQELATN